jgi:hypothetical protein
LATQTANVIVSNCDGLVASELNGKRVLTYVAATTGSIPVHPTVDTHLLNYGLVRPDGPQTTLGIAFNASAATIVAALQSLLNVPAGTMGFAFGGDGTALWGDAHKHAAAVTTWGAGSPQTTLPGAVTLQASVAGLTDGGVAFDGSLTVTRTITKRKVICAAFIPWEAIYSSQQGLMDIAALNVGGVDVTSNLNP